MARHTGSPVPGSGPPPRCDFTSVFEDALATGNRLYCENASPMNR
jgi:hypothetical protein